MERRRAEGFGCLLEQDSVWPPCSSLRLRLKAVPLYEESKTSKISMNQGNQSPRASEKATICLSLNKSANLDGLTRTGSTGTCS